MFDFMCDHLQNVCVVIIGRFKSSFSFLNCDNSNKSITAKAGEVLELGTGSNLAYKIR